METKAAELIRIVSPLSKSTLCSRCVPSFALKVTRLVMITEPGWGKPLGVASQRPLRETVAPCCTDWPTSIPTSSSCSAYSFPPLRGPAA